MSENNRIWYLMARNIFWEVLQKKKEALQKIIPPRKTCHTAAIQHVAANTAKEKTTCNANSQLDENGENHSQSIFAKAINQKNLPKRPVLYWMGAGGYFFFSGRLVVLSGDEAIITHPLKPVLTAKMAIF